MDSKVSPTTITCCSTTTGRLGERFTCVVCGDESDGLHFGQYTCRACAAFFRRSVSLKLQYNCKRNGQCEIEKSARNMCRACRFKRCIEKGMLASQVQHARDGLGKRKDIPRKSLTPSSSNGASPQEKKSITTMAPMQQQNPQNRNQLMPPPTTTTTIYSQPSIKNSTIEEQQQSNIFAQQQHQQPLFGTNPTLLIAASQGQTPLLFTTAPTTGPDNFSTGLDQTAAILHLNNPNNNKLGQSQIVNNFSHLQLNSAGSAFSRFSQGSKDSPSGEYHTHFPPGSKRLPKMVEGYRQFLTLRKASYTLVDGIPFRRNANAEIQSNFETSKKVCKLEASLIMDIIEKYFHPFGELHNDDKVKLFDNFYCLFSNMERVYRTYRTFEEGDDRLMMPDGGYIRLSQLEKFYENTSVVRGEPAQMAKIFEDAMRYVLKVTSHVRKFGIDEIEMIAIVGMFVWSDAKPDVEISEMVSNIARQVRDEIIMDLHLYYKSIGYSEMEITLKVANLFMIIPKIETLVRLLKENFSIAELFNMVDTGWGACVYMDSNSKCS